MEYHQGLDRVAAPLYWLSKGSVSIATSLLSKLVKTHLSGYYALDGGSKYLRSSLTISHTLLQYWDPELSMHHVHHGVHPVLYMVPW